MIRFALAFLLLVLAFAASPAHAQQLYDDAKAAQQTCPSQKVVWFELGGRYYYDSTQQQYGKGGGAFACERVARQQQMVAAPKG